MLSPLGYHRAVLAYVRRVDERAWTALRGADWTRTPTTVVDQLVETLHRPVDS